MNIVYGNFLAKISFIVNVLDGNKEEMEKSLQKGREQLSEFISRKFGIIDYRIKETASFVSGEMFEGGNSRAPKAGEKQITLSAYAL